MAGEINRRSNSRNRPRTRREPGHGDSIASRFPGASRLLNFGPTQSSRWPLKSVCFLVAILLSVGMAGCGGSEPAAPTSPAPIAAGSVTAPAVAPPPKNEPRGSFNSNSASPQQPSTSTSPTSTKKQPATAASDEPRRNLSDLLSDDAQATAEADATIAQAPTFKQPTTAEKQPLPVSDTKAAIAGIRRLSGKHLTMYTDLPPAEAVDELPRVFDLAVPQWCQYFGVDAARVADWHMVGCVMQDKRRFEAVGLVTSSTPKFRNGFQQGKMLWLNDQPTDYYRRHLLLHEGTHGFMNLILGGSGPPWYSEGMAELLGTHQWADGDLTLGYMPRDKSETPDWGRIKIVKDAIAEGRGMMPENILQYGPTAHLENDPYGWCWAAAAFYDAHPKSQKVFRQMHRLVDQPNFTARFRTELRDVWSELTEDWQLFAMNIDYGYDIARAAIERKPAEPISADGHRIRIAADRGWQSTGVKLTAGTSYEITAAGQFQVGHTSKPWLCEPNGVTIEYYQGRPLGMLVAAVRDDDAPLRGLTPLARAEPIGLHRLWSPAGSGTLYLKINESPAGLADNQGHITVEIRPQPGQ